MTAVALLKDATEEEVQKTLARERTTLDFKQGVPGQGISVRCQSADYIKSDSFYKEDRPDFYKRVGP